MKNRVLIVIPARAGSKRLPNKNIKLLCGKPLIAWTIEQALESNLDGEVVVTTDDPRVIEICSCYRDDRLICHRRPDALGGDDTSTIDVVLEVLDTQTSLGVCPDTVVLLQPTSPLREPSDIVRALEQFRLNGSRKSLASVSAVSHPTAWNGKITERGYFDCDLSIIKRSQDYPSEYHLNGAIYISPVELIKSTKSFLSGTVIAFKMPNSRSIDIDSIDDFEMSEFFMLKRINQSFT